ncbi:MAG: hypothetical protein JWL81_1587 [Verrucomicrobiales bacterium]|nr:hypothetical protein [Verrucomicrobiales bacterium]
MSTIQPGLRMAATALPVRAGWIPVPDVRVWLEEAARVEEAAPGAGVRFYPLPASASNPSVSGAVITVSGKVDAALDSIFSPRVHRLGEALPGVLIPVDSRLTPALTSLEQARLFPWALHFMHPVLGLAGFAEADALLPWQLLEALPVARGGWFSAVPGPVDPPLLRQVTLELEVDLKDILAGASDDISSRAEAVPGAGGMLDKAGDAAGWLVDKGLGMLGSLGGRKAADAIRDWARPDAANLKNRRHRELNKLLDRFEKDTLDALRHAIPLTGADARRGQPASPGWKLGARNPDLRPFSQGGGVVDVWNIPGDIRLKLEKQYREAAAREAAAGHWGRAAYIFGELLGDWSRAAEMLEKAGRPRDAARIYLERLRSGLRAAQCLAEAGLLAEAAALYEEAGQHEKAGDLFADMGRKDAAREQWEKALRFMTDPLQQAVLLEKKLLDPDRALAVLWKAWPGSPAALPCFTAWLDLSGRLGRHAEVSACLDEVEAKPAARPASPSLMVSGLLKLFLDYPDSSLRQRSAELAVMLAGEALAATSSRRETTRLLEMLPRFSPGDRLLARDAGRFSLTKFRPSVPLLERESLRSNPWRPSRIINLDAGVKWQSLSDSAEGLHVAGYSILTKSRGARSQLVSGGVTGGAWPKVRPGLGFDSADPRVSHGVPMAPGAAGFYHSRQVLEVVTDFPNEAPGLRERILAAGPAADGEWVLLGLMETGTLSADYVGPDGHFRRSRVLDFAPPGLEKSDWFTAGQGADLWIAGMDVVCRVTEAGAFEHVAVAGPVSGLVVAPAGCVPGAMVVAGGEVVLLTPGVKGQKMDSVSLHSGAAQSPPVAAFLRDGRAVVADGREGTVWETGKKGCRKTGGLALPAGSGNPLAMTGLTSGGFAILTNKGLILCFES